MADRGERNPSKPTARKDRAGKAGRKDGPSGEPDLPAGRRKTPDPAADVIPELPDEDLFA